MNMSPRRWLVKAVVPSLVVSILLTPIVANRFEKRLIQPTAQIMTFLLTGQFAEHRFNEGLPYVYYRRLGESHPNPVYASVYAFWYYERFTGVPEFDYFLDYYNIAPPAEPAGGYLSYFYNVADWLVESLVVRDYLGRDYAVWEYPFEWEVYGLEPSWVSGMAQGLGIQVLLRAWLESGNDKYIEAINLARQAFEVPVTAGGVTIFDADDSWWYEEYASPTAVESRVFNGAAHAVIALFELAKETSDPDALVLAERGLNSLVASLATYDAGWWTYYDALGLMSNYKYHHVNINLARHLGEQTGQRELLNAAAHWAEYQMPFVQREFIKQRPQVSDVGLLLLAGGLTFAATTVLATVALALRNGRKSR